jgi:hypothetical protein
MTIIRNTTIHSKVTAGNDYSLKLRTLYMYKRRPKGLTITKWVFSIKGPKPRPSKDDHNWFKPNQHQTKPLASFLPSNRVTSQPVSYKILFFAQTYYAQRRATTIMISVRIHTPKQDKAHHDIKTVFINY